MKHISKLFLVLTILTLIFTINSSEIKVDKELELNKELFNIINLPSHKLSSFLKNTKLTFFKDYKGEITKAALVKVLINAGADINSFDEGMTPLINILVAFNCRDSFSFDKNEIIDTLTELLKSNKLDINLGSKGGCLPIKTTALMIALKENAIGIKILKLLLTKNPDLFITDVNGKSAFDYAYGKKRQLLIDYVIRRFKPIMEIFSISDLAKIQIEYLC